MTTPVSADTACKSEGYKTRIRSQILDAARAKAAKTRLDKRRDEIRAYNRAYTQVLNKAYRARELAALAAPDDAGIRSTRLSAETYAAARAAGKAA